MASLRRLSSGSFGQFGAFAASALAGGGRSSLGGTTSGDRSRYSMPFFSMLLRADAGHQIVDELLFEGHVVVIVAVVTGADRACRHDETDAEGYG